MTVGADGQYVPTEAEYTYYSASYEQRTTIQHWQLRDLIHTDPTGSQVYAVSGMQIWSLDTCSAKSSVVMDLDFGPTSMTAKGRWLAVGGAQQQLTVLDMEAGESSSASSPGLRDGSSTRKQEAKVHFEQLVGGTVNNALHIGNAANDKELLFVCNNDDTVKIYDVGSMQALERIRFEVAINYCALSPDGTRLACVGDRPQVYLYQATPTGFQKGPTLSEAKDAGMCCGWSPGGHVFGAAFQCGRVGLWDDRQQKAVRVLRRSQPVRSIKFSSGPMDLIAFAEHEGWLCVADARCLDRTPLQAIQVQCAKEYLLETPNQQICSITPNQEPCSISGIAFSPDGTRLYVGTQHCVEQHNVRTPLRLGFPERSKI